MASKSDSSKKSFNLIDFIIIILILCVCAAAIYAYVPGIRDLFGKDSIEIEYCFVMSGISEDIASQITTGDSVLCEKVDFGNVRSVTRENSRSYAYSENSKSVVMSTSNENFDTLIVVRAEAKKTDDGYTVSGKRISAGLEYELVLPEFAGTALCIYVTEEVQ